ncbi:hypothetical protein [Maricaulis salignorans]|uniref:Uncharacterized protein n=1 Tax=Maricaulis salignorans TaxID=144026 RepID=A0A1G9LDE6_9PROT|nr:hypothetical protein [Maricaulis salignorans]SDL59777.1 hypothetical protein SAMN04488568_1018 [Maricaulis salignorans]
MIDHTLDHLPKRTNPESHALRGGRTWFSNRTISRARHFADLSWTCLCVPLAVSVALVASGQVLLSGDLAALANLLGGIGLIYSAHRILSKLTLGFERN